MAAPPCEATQGAERLTKSGERNREGGGPDDRGGQTWPRTGPADAFTHGGRKRGDRAGQLRLSTEWSRGKRACRHAADTSAGHRCGGPGRCKVWKLTDLDTTDGLRDFLGLPCNEGAGEGSATTPPPVNSERSDKGRKEPAGPPEKGVRREPDRSDSEDDPEESPPPRDFGDKLGLPDYGPICCGCGMGSCRGIQHRQALDYSTMITRRAGGAGSPRIAICLAPARNGTDRRLCGHTPCERCVVWVRGSPMCPCCANRAMAYGSQLQGAGPLPPLDARNRQAVPEGGAGKPPPASGQGRDRRVDLISRGEAPARARSRTPVARTASPRRPASPDGRTGGEESGPPKEAAPRRPAEASPGAPRPASPARGARDEERSPRGAERPRNNMESSEEEEVTDEEEDREGLYRNIAGSKGDWAERPERAGGDWESHHRRECMNPHCNRPARGSDEICCGRCTETQGREHSFNCNARTVYGDDKRRSGRPWGGGDGGNGPPDRGDPNRRRGSGGGKPSKKPSKAARDRERNLFRKGGKGKGGRSHLQLTFGKALKLAVATAGVPAPDLGSSHPAP